jgi:hypothetical protein
VPANTEAEEPTVLEEQPSNVERAPQIYRLGVDVPANTEAEEPTVLEDGNRATVNGPYRVTVLG